MYTTIGTYYSFQMNDCCPGWNGYYFEMTVILVGLDSNTTRTTDSYLKRIINTNCCIHTVVPPDDGPRYVQNM